MDQPSGTKPCVCPRKIAPNLPLSLDTLSEEEAEQAWLIEADRRARELDRGEVQPISADEVRRKVTHDSVS